MEKLQKVYIVIGTDSPSYGDSSFISKVFADKQQAEKYAQLQNELEEDIYDFYVQEQKVEQDFDVNSRVATYYTFYIQKDNFESIDLYNDETDTEKRIYDGDLIVENNENYIQVFSIIGFEQAKREAMKLFQLSKK